MVISTPDELKICIVSAATGLSITLLVSQNLMAAELAMPTRTSEYLLKWQTDQDSGVVLGYCKSDSGGNYDKEAQLYGTPKLPCCNPWAPS